MNIHNETNLFTKPKTELRQSYKCCFTYFVFLKETVDCQLFCEDIQGWFDFEGKVLLHLGMLI